MAANQYERHGQARSKLKEIFAKPDRSSVIHYSCESFYNLPDGRSPRITSIAIRKLDDAQTESFSIHQVAELRGTGLSSAEIEPYFNEYEKAMLDGYFNYIRLNGERTYIHWNMRDHNYGFRAIEHRYRVLGGDPVVVQDDRKLDLSRLFINLYGPTYIGDPRLTKLVEKNGISDRDLMSGQQEADAFEAGAYVDLHRSTLRKVDAMSNLARMAFDKSLKTEATWKEAHGLSWRTFLYLAKKHWIFTTLVFFGSIAGVFGSIFRSYISFTAVFG